MIIDVSKPEDCPFRQTVQYYDADDEHCGIFKISNVDRTCTCTDDRWIEGCPLLKERNILTKKV